MEVFGVLSFSPLLTVPVHTINMTTYRDSLIVAMAMFLCLDTAVVAARLYVRTRVLSRAFGRDDFVLCLTYVSGCTTCLSQERRCISLS